MQGITWTQKLGVTNRSNFTEHQEWQLHELKSLRDQSIVTEKWEYETGKLYVWFQTLSLEDIG